MKPSATRRAFALAAVSIATGPAAAQEELPVEHGMMTYPVFEETVTHADLGDCPPGFDPAMTFCRLTVAQGRAHVFVFELGGAQALRTIRSYDLDVFPPEG